MSGRSSLHTIIFAGGEFTDGTHVRALIDPEQDMVICADSGLRHAQGLGIAPDIIVGDFDSYAGELPEGVEIHRCKREKNDTDTMLAVKMAVERGCTQAVLIGGFGGRLDHTIANIQTMVYAREHGCELSMIDGSTLAFVQDSGSPEREYSPPEDWYFSVFALTDSAEIEYLSGVKYPLSHHVLTSCFPLGVSNEIIGGSAVMKVADGMVLVICSRR